MRVQSVTKFIFLFIFTSYAFFSHPSLARGGRCGGYGQNCCTRGAPCNSGTLACQSGICSPCGNISQICCAGSTCNGSTLACVPPGQPVANSCQTCGGYAQPCCAGATCTQPGYICQSGMCINSCFDGVQDGSESDVDCGGSCADCALGKHCFVNDDCKYPDRSCSGGTCVQATCSDGIKNGTSSCTLETDVDCGGASGCPPCTEGKSCVVSPCCSGACATNADCEVTGVCMPGNLCWVGTCYPGTSCTSGVCGGRNGTCIPSHCGNGVQDGDETDVNCGGPSCSPCNVWKHCLVNADCWWNICESGVCLRWPVHCGNSTQDVDETDVDCGGSCYPCGVGKHCAVNNDCLSNNCVSGACQ